MTFHEAAKLADVPQGASLAIELEGHDLALVRDGETVYCIEDWCSHGEIPLSDGDVEGCEIECFLHGSRFSLRTGEPTGLPATVPVSTFPVELRDGEVYVDVSRTLNNVRPT